VLRERRAHNPLMSLRLLREKPNYLGATLSQGLAGMAEMGLGLIFPLVLILNLQLDPALAGLALIPTTVPMVVMAPLAGRWYDRSGGRPPMITGFALLAVSGVALAIGVGQNNYFWLLPGLLIYGTGLAIVLTVNDPVSLDTVPECRTRARHPGCRRPQNRAVAPSASRCCMRCSTPHTSPGCTRSSTLIAAFRTWTRSAVLP